MKRFSKQHMSLLALVAVASASHLQAQTQKDSLLNRELLLEKEFIPIVREADKINKLPEVEAPRANKTQIVYSNLESTVMPNPEANALSAGDIMTDYPFSKKRGYLSLSGGNYMNFNGDFGYRFIDNDKTAFGIDFSHRSTNQDVDFVDPYEGGASDTKLKQNDNNGNIYVDHQFRRFNFKSSIGYDFSKFNLYGQIPDINTTFDATDYQTDDITRSTLRFNLGGESNTLSKWQYSTRLGVVAYNEKSREWDETLKELQTKIGFGASKSFRGDWKVGADFDLNMLFYMQPAEFALYRSYENVGTLRVNPYFDLNREGINLRLGLNVDMAYGIGPNVAVAPEVKLDWRMAEGFYLYTDVVGGLHQYSAAEIAQTHRYALPFEQLKNSYDVADFTMGIRSNRVAGFWFDIYAGYAFTKNERFYESEKVTVLYTDPIRPEYMFHTFGRNSLIAFTDDASKYKIGVKSSYDNGGWFAASLKLQRNGWMGESSYKPGFESAVNVTLRPMTKLLIGIDYHLYADRRVRVNEYFAVVSDDLDFYAEGSSNVVKMDPINDLRLRASWIFNKTFSASVQLNNLTGQRYDLWSGMPAQGFNFQIGGAVRF